MLFVTWVADPFRPTRDLDLLGQGDSDTEAIAETFRAICAQPIADDGVAFDVAALMAAPIREEVEYGGGSAQRQPSPGRVSRSKSTSVSATPLHPPPSRSAIPPCWTPQRRNFAHIPSKR